MKRRQWLLAVLLVVTFLGSGSIPSVSAQAKLQYYWLDSSGTPPALQPLVTDAMLGNKEFKKEFLNVNGLSNIAVQARLVGWVNFDGSNDKHLNYANTYKHYENKKDTWHANYRWTPTHAVTTLMENQGLSLYVEAQFRPDNHTHPNHGLTKKNDRAALDISTSKGYIGWIGNEDDPDRTFTTHSATFPLDTCDWVNFMLHSTFCGCGSSWIRNTVAAVVDSKRPEVKSARITSDLAGLNPIQYLSSGETGYVTLELSESMRFAQDPLGKGLAFDLYLDLCDAETQTSLDTRLAATLYRMSGTRMIFAFETPSEINGAPTNVYISGISKDQPQMVSNTPRSPCA